MADRNPGPSGSSSSLNEVNRKRRPSNIDTSPPTHPKRSRMSANASHEPESPVAGPSQIGLGRQEPESTKVCKTAFLWNFACR
ncbi:hypothetical protein QCA50_004350 [Cerrena zonata]|uniref:Uncharacterized protein n=1 Tax=Cerrena zonata TaxID=2478898 RepID=A0AAW0GLB3_9APHY